MLKYKETERTSLNQSKEYHYLGTMRSHYQIFYDSSWGIGSCNEYDLRHNIYTICNHHEIFYDYDIYDDMDNHYFNQLITTNVEIPKINHIKHYYRKKVMKDLILSFKTKPQRWLYSIRGYIKREMSCVVCFSNNRMDIHNWKKCGTCDTLVCGACFPRLSNCPMCREEYSTYNDMITLFPD